MLSSCATLQKDFPRAESHALPPATDTGTALYVGSEVGQRQGQSGFRLLTLSTNALLSRIALIDHAAHSLDLQYYIYHNDATGRLVTQHLLSAADRGVRVRLLLDHLKIAPKEAALLEVLDAHERVEVRFFNPFSTRSPGALSIATEMMMEGRRLNRRMHNKLLVEDNVVAILGGRNIGDDYFDASSDLRFRDLDLVAIGPVVPAASASFDQYWNAEFSYPLKAFKARHATAAEIEAARQELTRDVRAFEQSDYAKEVSEDLPDGPSAARRGDWFWGPAELVADKPEKVEADTKEDHARRIRIGPRLKTVMDEAQHELLLISPYFIPGDRGTAYFTALEQRGVQVKVLTNSLASTDEPLVHAAYVHYRKDLLAGGVQLYELKPAAVEQQKTTAAAESSGISLHAKAFQVDRRYVFVGSLNIDPRSRLLNTEIGVIVDCPPLAEAVTEYFGTATQPGNAYELVLEPPTDPHGKLRWQPSDGKGEEHAHEPGANPKRRMQVALMRLFPIDGLL